MIMRQLGLNLVLSLVLVSSVSTALLAQFDPTQGCVVDVNRECIPNTLLTATPFLKIVPDARAGAMGDAGLATSADANSMHFNASKLAFAEQDFGLSVTYTPWLRELGLTDVFLAYLSGYNKLTDDQAIGFSLKFFSLGDINFTDINGGNTGMGRPREFEISGAYSRKLGDNLSAGFAMKYIYSNLASGQQVQGIDINTANAFAADVSLTYVKEVGANGNELSIAGALSNLGSKVSYTNSSETKDFLPGNIGIGGAYKMNFDEYNSITFALDINKLLVPTPQPFQIFEEVNGAEVAVDNPLFDQTGDEVTGGPDGIGDYRQLSTFSGIFGSFTDAEGGFSEELKELTYSLGVEYLYNNQFAVRTGYYFENELKGDRQYLTLGVGLKYNVASINISYLIPTSNRRSPLDNTLRFSFIFDAAAFRS